MKIMKLNSNITVILENGDMLTSSNCTEEMHNEILQNIGNEEAVKCILMPEFCKKKEEIEEKTELLNNFEESDYLTVSGSSVYIKSISELTVPEDLAMALWKAEKEENEELISTYLNFWTLACLNPDSRARTNLFWFLNKYGMHISTSGLFVAYRNVVLKSEGSKISSRLAKFISNEYTKVKFKWKKSPANYYVGQHDGDLDLFKNENDIHDICYGNLADLYVQLSEEEVSPTYTDGYTGKFRIKIGEPVSMDRKKCDSTQENTCSRGLHVAGKSWLSANYFGNTPLRVLVNPADVVAVPPQDSYGKMRTAAYYPISIVEFDEEGLIIDEEIQDGFEDDFLNHISYEGDINEEDLSSYTINIPVVPEVNRDKIIARLDEIKESLKNKTV